MTAANQGSKPAFREADIRTALREYDRTPFLDILADWLEAMPGRDEVAAFARSRPHLYMMALKQLSSMAGFSEKREVAHSHTLELGKMSDVELELQLIAKMKKMNLPMPLLIEQGEVVDVDSEDDA